MDERYDAKIVGKEALPVIQRPSKWVFLKDMLEELHPGQVIRLVLPEGQSISGVKSTWIRFAKLVDRKGSTRTKKQPDGTIQVFLWLT